MLLPADIAYTCYLSGKQRADLNKKLCNVLMSNQGPRMLFVKVCLSEYLG